MGNKYVHKNEFQIYLGVILFSPGIWNISHKKWKKKKVLDEILDNSLN